MLATDDVTTFFHELSHAVDHRLPGQNADYAFGECVAELTSCCLCHLYGLLSHQSRTKAYIQSYQGTAHVAFEIIHVIERVMAIYEFPGGTGAAAARCRHNCRHFPILLLCQKHS